MTEAEFREAFHCHQSVVYRFAYRMTGSGAAAEDVVQDCFVAFWRKPEGYRPHRGTLRAYLLGVARNLVLKRWRGERQHEAIEDWTDDEAFICGPLDLAAQERAEAVRQAVLLLPPLQREALILAEYEELSLEEIAAATRAEVAAVKSRLHRARGNLKQMLSPLFAVQR
ncbi:MAG TPA: RNA polymerase sigma factor [Bryobacteraceae bacterium]|jgi:RNA polymerase sigma-70 factor (ECF subfamily)